jgi:hypothetical protein
MRTLRNEKYVADITGRAEIFDFPRQAKRKTAVAGRQTTTIYFARYAISSNLMEW